MWPLILRVYFRSYDPVQYRLEGCAGLSSGKWRNEVIDQGCQLTMEYLYVIYISSGLIKSFLNFFEVSLNIDFTLLSGLLLIAWYFVCGLIKDKAYRLDYDFIISTYFLALFYIWINISIIYSLSSVYSNEKSVLFLTNVLAFIIPPFYGYFDLGKFLKIFAITSTGLGILFLSIFSQTAILSTEPAIAFNSLYLGIPEICGVCVLILNLSNDLFPSVVRWILVILNLFIIMLSGGRGPIVFTAGMLMLVSLGSFSSGSNAGGTCNSFLVKKPLILIILVLACLFLAYSYIADAEFLLDRSISRLIYLYNTIEAGAGENSIMVRIDHFVFSIKLIFDGIGRLFFGYGLGSYGILYNGLDVRGYPHNIILEILVETGLIGGIMFCAFLACTCRGHLKANPFVWITLYLLLNAMKSSSLVDLRIFFAFLSLLLIHSKNVHKRFELGNHVNK